MNNLLGQFEYRGTHAEDWESECKKAREELSRQKEINVKLVEALKFQFVLSVGLIHRYTDEEVPKEIRQLALDLTEEIERQPEVVVIEMISRTVEALASAKVGV